MSLHMHNVVGVYMIMGNGALFTANGGILKTDLLPLQNSFLDNVNRFAIG